MLEEDNQSIVLDRFFGNVHNHTIIFLQFSNPSETNT